MTLLNPTDLQSQLKNLNSDWQYDEKNQTLNRLLKFKDFYQTMAFINALAFEAHHSNHHPDLSLGYNTCTVSYTTHDAGGVTQKDVDAARTVDNLFKKVV